MSFKRRSQEEICSIIEDVKNGMSNYEICKKYDIGETAIGHILSKNHGDPKPSNTTKRIKALEKQLQEREEEIDLLKRALKKR